MLLYCPHRRPALRGWVWRWYSQHSAQWLLAGEHPRPLETLRRVLKGKYPELLTWTLCILPVGLAMIGLQPAQVGLRSRAGQYHSVPVMPHSAQGSRQTGQKRAAKAKDKAAPSALSKHLLHGQKLDEGASMLLVHVQYCTVAAGTANSG